MAAGLLYGLASWIRTKYWIDDDELRVDKGVIARQSRRIRIDRLQGVDIVQPLVARFFGLAELRFDVASGSDREGVARVPAPPGGAGPAGHAAAPARRPPRGRRAVAGPRTTAGCTAASPERELARLDLGLLVASLVLSPEAIITALAVARHRWGLPRDRHVRCRRRARAGGDRLRARDQPGSSPPTTASGSAESPAGLHVSRGLTSLSSQTIALRRVQGLVLSEPWLWRHFGWAKLEVSVAGYGSSSEADKAQPSSTLMPVAPRAQCVALLDHVLGGSADSSVATIALTPAALAGQVAGAAHLLVARVRPRRPDRREPARAPGPASRRGPARAGAVGAARAGAAAAALGLADLEVDSPPGPVRVQGHQRDAASTPGSTAA